MHTHASNAPAHTLECRRQWSQWNEQSRKWRRCASGNKPCCPSLCLWHAVHSHRIEQNWKKKKSAADRFLMYVKNSPFKKSIWMFPVSQHTQIIYLSSLWWKFLYVFKGITFWISISISKHSILFPHCCFGLRDLQASKACFASSATAFICCSLR